MLNKSITTLSIVLASLLFMSASHAGHHEMKEDHAGHNEMKKDIVDVAVENGSFTTLVAALKAGGLVDTLKGDGPFTVFAPTDDAFAKLPEGTVEMLLKPENKDKLVAILTYHVVSGKVMAKDVMEMKMATTVQGSMVKVKVVYGSVMIDNAEVVMADVKASNGVIHVVDTVLMPK
ncbi:MAG: putative surface protein with fasciclin (FAS1) repeats [Congregibacter sp.]|jgi:uncharacterized surface protein with fasciclin (FAS1) repeats